MFRTKRLLENKATITTFRDSIILVFSYEALFAKRRKLLFSFQESLRRDFSENTIILRESITIVNHVCIFVFQNLPK
jgi:hypothetical protein